MIIGCPEDNPCADTELVLPVSLKVSEFGIEVVGLNGANPDVFGDGYVEASTDGGRIGCVVASGKLADGSGKVAIKAMYTSEESLSKRLEPCVVGDTHSDASHSIEDAKAYIEARDVISSVTSCLDHGGEVSPDRYGDASVTTGHPEAATAADWRVCIHLAEHRVGVNGIVRPLCRYCLGER